MKNAYTKTKLCIVALSATFLLSTQSSAEMLNKGKILNADGDWCWFQQEQIEASNYFSEKITSNMAVMTFDEPACMKVEADSINEIINFNQINKMIGNWYSHDDAKFLTGKEELIEANGIINKGFCMSSETYPDFSVALSYELENNAVTKVFHTHVHSSMCE